MHNLDIEDYISSGILEAFMLGDLSKEEQAEVEKNLMQYPELRREFERLQEAQESFLLQTAIRPPASVKANLFKKIERRDLRKDKPSSLDGPRINYWQYAAAASIVVAIISSYLAYDYRNKLKEAQTSLTEYIAQNQRMAQDYNNVNRQLEQIENDLAIITDPSFQRILLKGTANAPNAVAQVFWNPDTKAVFLRVENMKRLARENQYQLWAIVDGKPVSAGVFDTLTGLRRMKDIAGAAAFAVTIEPHGGKESPSLQHLQVIGNVEKS